MARQDYDYSANNHYQRNNEVEPHPKLLALSEIREHVALHVHAVTLMLFGERKNTVGAARHNSFPFAHNVWMRN